MYMYIACIQGRCKKVMGNRGGKEGKEGKKGKEKEGKEGKEGKEDKEVKEGKEDKVTRYDMSYFDHNIVVFNQFQMSKSCHCECE